MAWCPNCKNEFVEGIKICPKCDVSLVDALDEKGNPVSEEMSDDFDSDSFNAALDNAFGDMEPEESLTENINEIDIIKNRTISSKEHAKIASYNKGPSVYQKTSERAEEMKSSAFSLIIVGFAGLICMVLLFFEIIPIKLNTFSHYTIPLVMGVIFIILIIAGFLSIKSFKNLKKDAGDEDRLEKEIEDWYKTSLTKDYIEKNLPVNSDESEEEKYFTRYAKINALLKGKFMNLDPLFSDHIVEDIYHYLYESDD